jgi:hypothetical protein
VSQIVWKPANSTEGQNVWKTSPKFTRVKHCGQRGIRNSLSLPFPEPSAEVPEITCASFAVQRAVGSLPIIR